MKRNVLFLVLLLFALATRVSADELNQQQTALRSALYNFVKNKGYNPTYDSDGDVKFTVDGSTYYFSIYASDVRPMFVTLSTYMNIPTNQDKGEMLTYLGELNVKKGVKGVMNKAQIRFEAQWYLLDASEVTMTFDKYLSQVDAIYNQFKGKFNSSSSYSGGGSQQTVTSTVSWPTYPVIGYAKFGVTTYKDLINKGVTFSKMGDSDIYEGCWYHGYNVQSNNEVVAEITVFRNHGGTIPDFLAACGVRWNMSMSQLENVLSMYGWKEISRSVENGYLTFKHTTSYYIFASFTEDELNWVKIEGL